MASRRTAINYLERKGVISGKIKYSEKEEKEIEEVMKKGKIYGDPVAILG